MPFLPEQQRHNVFTDVGQIMSINRRPSHFVIFSQVKAAGIRFLSCQLRIEIVKPAESSTRVG